MLLEEEQKNTIAGAPNQSDPNTQANPPQVGMLQPTTPAPTDTKQPAGGDTVEGRLTSLLEKDNPYLVGAMTRAAQTSNTRGLLNTSIGAGAGEAAAIESALPIAQQDAQYYQSRGLQEQQGDIQSNLQGEAGDIESRHIGERGDVQSDLYQEQGDIQKDLYQTQGDISSRLQAEKAEIDTRLAQMGYTHETAMKEIDNEWNKIDLQARMDVEYDRMDQETKTRFDSTSAQITSEYQQMYMEILSDPTYATTADRKVAIERLGRITQQRFDVAAKIAGVDLNWHTYTPNWSTA